MDKLKTLLGRTNARILIGGLIRYAVECLLIMLLKPWWLAMIVCALLIIPFGFMFMCSLLEDEPDRSDVVFMCIWSVISAFLQWVVVYVTFEYIHWVAVPAIALGNMILMSLIYDYEPRTKTTPSDKEAIVNENYTVDGEAQTVPDYGDGSCADRDSKVEKPKEYSGRYNWNTGKPIEREEEK